VARQGAAAAPGSAVSWRWVVGVGLVVAVVAALGAGARAGWLSRTVADEPQYLLTATSLWEDRDLDIADELADRRWLDYHEAPLPEQTAPRPDGRRLSPHDPLLPALLAAPVGLGGWMGARLALAGMAGVLAAALVWTAQRRFGVAAAPAGLVVGGCAVVPPLVAYGGQIYPELPAALAVTAVVAASTGRRRPAALAVAAAGLVALPWLSVKYAPVAAALAAALAWTLWRDGRRRALGVLCAAGAAAAVIYLAAHQAWYGGWTVYAAGDHFVGGELTVMGHSPDHLSRAQRLVGLLVDRDFGLVRWAPVWLLAVPALGALARRRPSGWGLLVVPLAAGWLNATFVALTMHGWWWPGRQVVVVLPLAVLALAWWAGGAWVDPASVPRRVLATVGLSVAGLWAWAWLVVEVMADRRRLVTDFLATAEPVLARAAVLLPDARRWHVADIARWWVWAVALVAWAAWSYRRSGDLPRRPDPSGTVAAPATAPVLVPTTKESP
jgi:hypothetical protein